MQKQSRTNLSVQYLPLGNKKTFQGDWKDQQKCLQWSRLDKSNWTSYCSMDPKKEIRQLVLCVKVRTAGLARPCRFADVMKYQLAGVRKIPMVCAKLIGRRNNRSHLHPVLWDWQQNFYQLNSFCKEQRIMHSRQLCSCIDKDGGD